MFYYEITTLQIAFPEELYLYCQANDINFPQLIL